MNADEKWLREQVFAPYQSEPSDLTVKDVNALVAALSETIRRVKSGEVRNEDIGDDLYYSINPWASQPAFDFLNQLVERLKGETWTRDE